MHLDSLYIENSDPHLHCHWKNSDIKNNTAGRYGTLGSKCDTPIPLVRISTVPITWIHDLISQR
jgi:hypothetical protein